MHGLSINSFGQISGYGWIDNVPHAFLWTPSSVNGASGTLLDLNIAANNMAVAQSVNDLGQVAGRHDINSNTLLWAPDAPNGISGLLTDIGDLPTGHGNTIPYGINSFGQITGQSNVAGQARAYLWTPNTPNGTAGIWNDLGTFAGATQATAKAINVRGQITGAGISGLISHAFVWSPTAPNGTSGSMVDIGDLPGGDDSGVGLGINAVGQVVGYSFATAGRRAFLWTPGTPNGSTGSMLNLGTLSGDNLSSAFGSNSSGYVVGESSINGNPFATHAFLWSAAGGMIDLNTVLNGSYPGWTLQSGESINEYGQITGTAIYDPDGPGGVDAYQRAYLLTPNAPLPEPTGAGLIALAALAGGLFRRRA
jgi:probable HAF family extracellular repeat protein